MKINRSIVFTQHSESALYSKIIEEYGISMVDRNNYFVMFESRAEFA